MQKIIQRWLVGIALACVFGSAIAFDSFVIRDIRVDGVRRLELGTVLTYLPFSIGDELDARSSRQGIKSLYETGLFQDIAFERDGDVLVIKVKERPAIASFEIEGNKKLGGDEIKEGLAQAGLAEGELYRRDLLDGVEQELRRQYYANGYYSVRIDTQVTEKGDNSVDIKIDVSEGPVAKINSINIVGNEVFEEDELVDDFELRPSRFISLFQSSNKYSKEKLLGDLERLTSYYQDRGYLRFEVSSVQVALSTNRRDISITINTNEGEIYTVEDTQLAGELVVKKEYLKRLVLLRPGDTFSRKLTTETGNLISRRLADEGYAFAKVDPLPRVDDEAKTVHLTFNVDSGKRVYVRQIGFTGNTATNDETLRREMRQLEGSSFSRAAVERSRERLQRLPFLQEVEVETEPVPGTDDLVDVDYKVSERPAGSVQVGVGFSDASGFLINGSLSHTNFRGTGDRINLQAERNEFAEYFNVSWTDPYATDDGISRTISGFFRNSEQVVRFSSGFDTNSLGAALTYGLPMSEFSSLRLGVGVDRTAVNAFANGTSNEILDFLLRNGSQFTNVEFRTGWTRDTRDRTIFPRRGMLNRLTFDITVPGSDLEFFRSSYVHQQLVPIFGRWALQFNGNISYGDGYGDSEDIPPYEHFFAGGADSVRGYRDGSIGPRDTLPGRVGNFYGGKMKTTLQSELIVPMPFLESDQKTTRLAMFYDVGGAFADADDFDSDGLRSSAGVAFSWFTPFFGLLKLSYGFPIDEQPADELDRFQISFGAGF